VPSLNNRKSDIPQLAEQFIADICKDYGIPVKNFTSEALESLQNINWTGNIRELRNVIERLVILCDKTISEKDVITYTGSNTSIK